MKPFCKISGAVFSFAMCGLVGAQVPNGNFETWTDDCTPADWAVNSVCGVFMPVTKSTAPHSGSFAARGEVISFFGQVMQPILQSGPEGTGFPISQRYSSVDGFYRFVPVGGDRFGFNVSFHKGETVVAQGAALFPATTGTAYAACSTPMTYFNETEIPDRAIIQIMIIGPVTGDDFHVGSVMHVDDVTFGTGPAPEPEPRLTIVVNGNSVTVSWPVGVAGFRLQQTPSLPATGWTDVPGLAATDRSYTFTPTTQAYFRLVKP